MTNPEEENKVQSTVADTLKSSDDPTNSLGTSTVYMMPESFNALRRYLQEAYPNLWKVVEGDMAWNAQRFILSMDEALDMVTQFDSANVDGICKRYLDKLRELKGLSPLHNKSEYHHNQEMENQVRFARSVHSEVAPWKTLPKH